MLNRQAIAGDLPKAHVLLQALNMRVSFRKVLR